VASGSLEGVVWAGDLAALIDVGVEIADVDAAEASERDRGKALEYMRFLT